MDATDNELLETQYYGCCVVDFYNQRRRHSTIRYISAAVFEREARAPREPARAVQAAASTGVRQAGSTDDRCSSGILRSSLRPIATFSMLQVHGGALGGSHVSPTDAYAYAAERLSAFFDPT